MKFTRRIFEEQLERAAQKAESNKHESCYLRRGPGVIYYSIWRFEAAINEMDGGYIYTVGLSPTGKKSSGHTSVKSAADACMKIRREYEKKRREEQCHSAES